jgi:hypothetical protein
MYLSSSSSVRWGLGIVAVIVLIYIVASVRSVMAGPVGQAIGSLLGTAGSVLAAIAGLPPWLLIGFGLAYLLGPAILKMGGALTRQLSSAIKEGNASVDALDAKSETYSKAYVDALATRLVETIRTAQADAAGAGQAEQERRATAVEARAAASSAAAAEGTDGIAGDQDGEARADEIMPVEEVRL